MVKLSLILIIFTEVKGKFPNFVAFYTSLYLEMNSILMKVLSKNICVFIFYLFIYLLINGNADRERERQSG